MQLANPLQMFTTIISTCRTFLYAPGVQWGPIKASAHGASVREPGNNRHKTSICLWKKDKAGEAKAVPSL